MPQQNIHKSHKPETWQSYDAVLSSTFLLHKRVSDSHFERLPADGKSLVNLGIRSLIQKTNNECLSRLQIPRNSSRYGKDWSLTAKANVDTGWLYDSWKPTTEFAFGIFETKSLNYVKVTNNQNCANIVTFTF